MGVFFFCGQSHWYHKERSILVSSLVLATLLQISVQAARVLLRERRRKRVQDAKSNQRGYKKISRSKFRKKRRR